MPLRPLLLALAFVALPACATAQSSAAPATPSDSGAASLDVSTHVLDLARGVGGGGVAVTLDKRVGDSWVLVGRATSRGNGRVESFDPAAGAPTGAGTYRLTFDMADYWASVGADQLSGGGPGLPFFPEITVVFRLDDPAAHTHVPVVVSPYGYSTYRGN